MFESMPERVTVYEVGPRDGLQNESSLVPTADKIAFINALARTGLTRIEILLVQAGREGLGVSVAEQDSLRAQAMSTLQQAASTRLGFSVKKTMTMAQRLYEAGHITYIRTDSTRLAASWWPGATPRMARSCCASTQARSSRRSTSSSSSKRSRRRALSPFISRSSVQQAPSGLDQAYPGLELGPDRL